MKKRCEGSTFTLPHSFSSLSKISSFSPSFPHPSLIFPLKSLHFGLYFFPYNFRFLQYIPYVFNQFSGL